MRPDSAARAQTPASPPPALATPQLLAGVRRSLGLEVGDLALRIGVSQSIVVALEQGRLEALPPWPETARIVTHWIGLAGIDPRPALSELAEHLSRPVAAVPAPARSSAAIPAPSRALSPPAVMARATEADDTEARIAAVARVLGNRNRNDGGWPAHDADATAGGMPAETDRHAAAGIRHRIAGLVPALAVVLGRARSAVTCEESGSGRVALARVPAWRFGVAGIALLVTLWAAAINTSVVAAAVSVLPAPAGRVIRSFSDFVAEYFAPVREGHRWIDVGDPRSRRADKLRTSPRLD